MTPEDQLRAELRDQLGDPDEPAQVGDASAVDATQGWAAIQSARVRRDRRTRALLASASAVAVAALVAGALLIAGQSSTTVSTAGKASSTTVGTARPSTTRSLPGATTATTTQRPTGTTSIPHDTGSVPVTTLGPPTTPSSTATSVTIGAIKDCGTDYLASGWPTTIAPSPQQQSCILEAFASGSYAIYTERAQTDGEGGHIEITTYQVIGPRRVRRTVDATGALPPGSVTVTVCTGLSGNVGPLVATGCTPA
jgi:hypothetical protein